MSLSICIVTTEIIDLRGEREKEKKKKKREKEKNSALVSVERMEKVYVSEGE